jgi:hypothetical protein
MFRGFSREIKAGILCNPDCVAEKERFESSIAIVAYFGGKRADFSAVETIWRREWDSKNALSCKSW